MSTEALAMEFESPMEIDGLGPASESLTAEVPTGNGVGSGNGSAAGNTVGIGATAFVCDHTVVPPNELHTCNHPYHAGYSETNLPVLLFQLDGLENDPSGTIHPLIENGEPVFDYTGRPMRDFPFLPRFISNKVPAWLLEYWMRTDSRLTYRDIKGRMIRGEKPLPTDNALNMRRERDARTPLQLSCWTTRRGIVTKAEVERASNLNADQVAYNTTMDIEYGIKGGVKQPIALRSKSLRLSASRFYPLDTYISFEAQPHIPSARLTEAIDMLYHLQDIALSLGMDIGDWRLIPSHYLPAPWVQKSMKLRKNPANLEGHDASPASQEPEPLESVSPSVVESPQSVTTVSFASPMTPPTPNMMSYPVGLEHAHKAVCVPAPVATRNSVIKRTKITLSDILNFTPATDHKAKPEPAASARHKPANPAPTNPNCPMTTTFAALSADFSFFQRANHSHGVQKNTPLVRNMGKYFPKLWDTSDSAFHASEK